jgi:hypothetical protein
VAELWLFDVRVVMAGRVPAISLRQIRYAHLSEITGTSPVMTKERMIAKH